MTPDSRPAANAAQAQEDPTAGAGSEPPLVLEGFLPYRLSVVANRISRGLADLYEQEFGLSIAEWRLLAILARFGPLSAMAVSQRAAMDKVRVSRAVARAAGRGLVARSVDADDRRRLTLSLTAEGWRIHNAIVPRARAREADLLEGMSPEDVGQFHDLLDRLQDRAERLGFADGAGATED